MSVLRGTILALMLALTVTPARSGEVLHESLHELESWLGEWTAGADSGTTTRTEYRAVLSGHFVEAWQRDAASGETIAHSMIGAGEGGTAAMEYRFERDGRLTVNAFDAASRPTGSRVADARVDAQFDAQPVALDRPLARLATFLGQWEVSTGWLDGGVLWAQMTNRAELGGRVIRSRVLAAENGEPSYDRFRTFYYSDDNGDPSELTFTYTGKVVQARLFLFPAEGKLSMLTHYEAGTMAPGGIRKRLTVTSERRMHWTDDFRDDANQDWERVIDAEWVRTAPADPVRRTMPVDDTRFAAAGAAPRAISVERSVDAAPDAVWNAWSNAVSWKAAYAPGSADARADIELAPGGRYEWLFDGQLGCNGCQVLSYLPPRMMSFTWNSPATQPNTRLRHTWVVVEIVPADSGGSLVRLTQLGFGDGPYWDETRDYFEKAWAYVLEQMAKNLG